MLIVHLKINNWEFFLRIILADCALVTAAIKCVSYYYCGNRQDDNTATMYASYHFFAD